MLLLYIVILEYSLYSKLLCCIHFIHWCRDPGIENRDSIAVKNALNEIVVNASWKDVGDMSISLHKPP